MLAMLSLDCRTKCYRIIINSMYRFSWIMRLTIENLKIQQITILTSSFRVTLLLVDLTSVVLVLSNSSFRFTFKPLFNCCNFTSFVPVFLLTYLPFPPLSLCFSSEITSCVTTSFSMLAIILTGGRIATAAAKNTIPSRLECSSVFSSFSLRSFLSLKVHLIHWIYLLQVLLLGLIALAYLLISTFIFLKLLFKLNKL